MCGRYSLITPIDQLQERFDFEGDAPLDDGPRRNIAPTQNVLTVLGGEPRRGAMMRWGLIPSWAKDAKIGNRMINARGETVAEKPSFRSALRRRRCLVLADGFYEWQRIGRGKRPMRIAMSTGEAFAFAGIWETWRNAEHETVRSCAIITTAPNELMAPIHDRMPVILPKEAESVWLDASLEEATTITSLLIPRDADGMEARETPSPTGR